MHADKGTTLAKLFRIWRLFCFTHLLNLTPPLKSLSSILQLCSPTCCLFYLCVITTFKNIQSLATHYRILYVEWPFWHGSVQVILEQIFHSNDESKLSIKFFVNIFYTHKYILYFIYNVGIYDIFVSLYTKQ